VDKKLEEKLMVLGFGVIVVFASYLLLIAIPEKAFSSENNKTVNKLETKTPTITSNITNKTLLEKPVTITTNNETIPTKVLSSSKEAAKTVEKEKTNNTNVTNNETSQPSEELSDEDKFILKILNSLSQ